MEIIVDKSSNRDFALDIIRSLAIIAVILQHCIEKLPVSYTVLGRLGVPCFFMLTGALLLSRDNIDTMEFHKKKTLYLYLLSVFWIYVYGLINNLSFADNIRRAITIQGTEVHLWYLSTIVFLYFLIPYMSNIKFLSNKNIFMLLVGFIVYRWLNIFFNFGALASDYLLYIAFVMFGFVVYTRKLYERISLKYFVPIFMLIILFAQYVYNQEWYVNLYKGYDINWYYSPFIVILSLMVFVILLKIFKQKLPFIYCFSNIIIEFSKCAFGIYVIHYAILCILLPYTKSLIVVMFFTIFLSFLIVSILGRNRFFAFLFHKR